MKFFVSGKLGDEGTIKTIMGLLNDAGHTITFDWTTTPHLIPFEEHVRESRECAISEVRGVKEADCLILMSHERGGVGTYIELGVALGNGIPVRIISQNPPRSTFFYHPLVKVVPSVQDVLKEFA